MKIAALLLALAFAVSTVPALADCIGCPRGPTDSGRVKCGHGERWDPDLLMCVPA